MFRITITFLCVFVGLFDHVHTYRILGIFPMNGRSHEMMFEALMKGLAKRGHQVDVITHFPVKNPPPNYNNIVDLSGTLPSVVNNFSIDFVMSFASDVTHIVGVTFGNEVCHLMGLEEIQRVLHNPPKKPPYDLLITEAFGANCYFGIGHHLNIPVIAASSAVEYPWVSDFAGNIDNPAVVPNGLATIFETMNFWQRLKNTLMYYKALWLFHYYTGDSQTKSMRKYINPNIPHIREVEKRVALTLVNSHPVLYGIKPVTPGLVQVGGVHIEENDSKLTPELKKWLNESKNGVVYFSFGSMVLIETLPQNTLKILYSSLAKLAPIRVLLKIVDTKKLPPGLPSNILTSAWLPQQPILAHNNTKVFVTHGGLTGTQEALSYGIPMVGIPIYGDQFRNVQIYVAKNMCIEVPFDNITEENLDRALQSVLFNPKFRKYAKYYSRLFWDRPISAMDTAEFWIKYVIRNGPDSIRSPALSFTWWQLALLDVFGFIFLVIILLTFLLYFILKFIIKTFVLFSTSKNLKKDKKIK